MPACESKLVSRSSRKAIVAMTVLIGQAPGLDWNVHYIVKLI